MALALMAALLLMDPDTINTALLLLIRHSRLEHDFVFVSNDVP
jgi:hypothetical protein